MEIEHWISLGEQALERGQAELAIDSFRRALTSDPNEPRAHALLALALLKLKRIGAALIEARTALTQAPELPLAHLVLGYVLLAHNKPKDARKSFEMVRAVDPSSVEALRGLASTERHAGHFKESRAMLEEAQRAAPDDPQTLTDLGELWLEEGKLDQAEQCAKAALEQEAQHSAALVLMGQVLLRKGDIKGAREHAVWALQAEPTAEGPIQLFVAIQARQSFLLGLWFRWSSWLSRFGRRAMIVLLVAFVVQRLAILALEDAKAPQLAELVHYGWLGLCVYSWVAPVVFRNMIKKEIEGVRLKPDF